MRLLHTTRLEVVYVATDVPPYAILSHTWDDEEATFQDVQSSGIAKQMRGYAKLEESCSLASGEGFEYIWVDSCCIDKTSSAELSEAVNSMFRWSSRWFTRGWALQEPTAPKTIHFYNQHWSLIGTRDDSARVLAMITFIPEGILVGGELPRTPINQRRHWVASRQTARPEDIAYCLLRTFDVHMPLIYGEGRQKAFRRLQEGMTKTSEDLTPYIVEVAWSEDRLRFSGPVPGFRERTSLTQLQDSSVNITNRGVAVKWYVVPLPYDTSETVFLALLTECGGVSDGIFIQRRNHEGSVFSLIVPLRVLSIETQGKNGQITLPYAETGVDVPLRHVQAGELRSFYLMRNTTPQHLDSSFGVVVFCFVDSNLNPADTCTKCSATNDGASVPCSRATCGQARYWRKQRALRRQRHLYTEDRVMHRLKSLMTPWAMAPHHKDLGLVNSVLTADGLKFSSLTPFTKVLGCSRVEVEAEVAIVRKELMESSSHALLDM
ncbi:ankyrin repeat-containing [Colletotrichum incanum]|uniref:Ankyrin repeat-containing n=1 Tax=Colletotrichum incanum TaxID=1573173 RepID=A0A161VZ30_COLIC|nr:ankyrin repeat-containing [Colletotrichum incanum]